MKQILVLGAGRSSYSLIRYLLNNAQAQNWAVVVGDFDENIAKEKIDNHPSGRAIRFDAHETAVCDQWVSQSDLVISLLPPALHYLAAQSAVRFGKSFLTASYISPEIKALDAQARANKVLIMNELGLDPGIDHLSAMQIIEKLKAEGANILSFLSYTGGLIAPESDNNPWNYKFTWNPRNVVIAGQGTAKYLQNGQYKYVPYHRLFSTLEHFKVDKYGEFEGYPNRDSLQYKEVYGLQNIATLMRGTLRRAGFCDSWNVFVQLGMTDDSYKMENSEQLTFRQFLNSFLPFHPTWSLEEKLANFLGVSANADMMHKLQWLGVFKNTPIGMPHATPAQILQKLLEEKWKLSENDKDMVVMLHRFEYELKGKKYCLESSMVLEGENTVDTAMAQTVGLPLGIGAKLILQDRIKLKGVQLPVSPEIYEPILAELQSFGVKFKEKITEIE